MGPVCEVLHGVEIKMLFHHAKLALQGTLLQKPNSNCPGNDILQRCLQALCAEGKDCRLVDKPMKHNACTATSNTALLSPLQSTCHPRCVSSRRFSQEGPKSESASP